MRVYLQKHEWAPTGWRSFLLLVLCLGLPGWAQDAAAPSVRLRARLEQPEMALHQVATLTVETEAPKGLAVKLPEPPKVEGIEVEAGAVETDTVEETTVQRQQFRFANPQRTGVLMLPGLQAAWEGGSAQTGPLALSVRALTEDEREAAADMAEDISPAAVLAEVQESRRAWWLAGITALIAAGVLYWWLRKAKPAVLAPPPTAWETAYLRLRELYQRDLPRQGRHDTYYVDLSAILRYYIEDRFQLRAPEQTTQEFLETAARGGVLSPDQQASVVDFLKHSDRVKFAQYVPTAEEMERGFRVVQHFVQETEPKPVSGTEVGEAPAETAA